MMKLSNKRQTMIGILLVIVILASFAFTGGLYISRSEKNVKDNKDAFSANQQHNIVYPSVSEGKKSLQFGTFLFASPTVTPTPRVSQTPVPIISPITRPTIIRVPSAIYEPPTPPLCPPILPIDPNCEYCPSYDALGIACNADCVPGEGGFIGDPLSGAGGMCVYPKDSPGFQNHQHDPNCSAACIAKPVIYLYPTKTSFIDVKVKTQGKIVISDPIYPPDGWKQIEAHPNGRLIYKGKAYRELFYESQADKINPPDKGIIIPKEDLKQKLTEATTKLGLVANEQQEFLDYWVPKLSKINSPFIFFSVLEKEEKERLDFVEVKPEPDTRIEFIAYFKPLKEKVEIKEIQLPKRPPKRIGFTFVEWGGTIDY